MCMMHVANNLQLSDLTFGTITVNNYVDFDSIALFNMTRKSSKGTL